VARQALRRQALRVRRWRFGQGRQAEAGWAARRQGRLAGNIYPILPRHAPWRVSAAPRSVARQTLPRHRSAAPVFATSPSCRATMHGTAQTFLRAMTIGATKSVSFEKKNSVRFKISLQKVLKIKKFSTDAAFCDPGSGREGATNHSISLIIFLYKKLIILITGWVSLKSFVQCGQMEQVYNRDFFSIYHALKLLLIPT